MRSVFSKIGVYGATVVAYLATACGGDVTGRSEDEPVGQVVSAVTATTPPDFIAVKDAFIDPRSDTKTGAHSTQLFVGRRGSMAGYQPVRSLLFFDLSSIPAGSVVGSATFKMTVTKAPGSDDPTARYGLYPVSNLWTSGTGTTVNSILTSDLQTPSAGDPTWKYRDGVALTTWNTPGGDFGAEITGFTIPASGTLSVSNSSLTSAVQFFVSTLNLGLMLKAEDESNPCPTTCTPEPPKHARGLGSVEATTSTSRPALSVSYCPPPDLCQNAPTYSGGVCTYTLKANGTQCRAAASGGCDKVDTCNGTSPSCPDTKQPTSFACRPAVAGGCDRAENCDGTTNNCPPDTKQPNTFVCRPHVDGCDLDDKCDGTTNNCPADAKAGTNVTCTSDNNVCTVDHCNGSGTCVNTPGNQGTICRQSGGVCDVAETCTGSSPNCPTDVKVAIHTACTPADGNSCTTDECNGTSNGCTYTQISTCVGWPTPTPLETTAPAGNADSPRIATNATGDVMVVWQQSDGTRNNVWARRYVKSTGTWAAPALVEQDNTGAAQYPSVGMDAAGNAICVWEQYDGTRYNAMANRFTPAGGWGATPVALENKTGSVGPPSVAVDPSGRAMAVFAQAETTSGYRVWAARFSGTSWGTAQALESASTLSAAPKVAVDPTGAALAVWMRQPTSNAPFDLWSARYSGGVWSLSGVAADHSADSVIAPDLALDQAGNGLVTYTREDTNFVDHPYALRFTVSGGWATPTRLDPTSGANTFDQHPALSAAGDGVVVWANVDAGAIRAQRYLAASGWGALTTINTVASGSRQPSVAVDGFGNAVAVWIQGGHLLANEMSPAGTWGTPAQVDNGSTVLAPAVVSTASGDVTAAWTQHDGTSSFQNMEASKIQLTHAEALVPPQFTVVECPVFGTGSCTTMAPPNPTWSKYRGTVLAPNEVIHNGEVLVDSNGVISCVGCNCPSPPDTTVVACPQGVISPGLINTHDHLAYANNHPSTHSLMYTDRQQWRGGTDVTYNAKTNDTTILAAAEFRQLMSGTTSVVTETTGGVPGFLRNLQNATWLEGGAPIVPALYTTFPFADQDGVLQPNCAYPNKDTSATYANVDAYLPHIAEGIDSRAHDEFGCASTPGTNNLIAPQTTVIHAMALKAADAQAMYAAGSFVSWAPRSEISLYGNTTPVTMLHAAGVPIALGTDWVVNGSINLLRELSCADSFNSTYLSHYFSDFQLWQMVTTNAAFAAGADRGLGMLRPGYQADLAIFDGFTRHDHRAVIGAGPEDVLLVVRGGRALYGDPSLMGAVNPACSDQFGVCTATRRACTTSEVGKDFAALSAALAPFYPLVNCGTLANEPTCTPSRPNEYPITGNDPDGDGILNDGTTDKCPGIFSPMRPMDTSQQPDGDPTPDGIPDACDVCPNGPCTPPNADDMDADGVMNGVDDCPGIANADQADSDADGKGDVCDACPTVPNAGVRPCPVAVTLVRDGSQPGHVTVNYPAFVQSVVVTGARPQTASSNGFYAQMVPERDYGGIFVFTGRNYNPLIVPGTVVDAVGSYQGDTGLGMLNNAIAIPTGSTSPFVILSTTYDGVMEGGPQAERWESMMVSVATPSATVPVLNQTPDSPKDFDEFTVGTIAPGLRVDDELYWALDNIYTAVPPTTFSKLQGVLTYSFGNHKLLPRSAADFQTP